MGIGNEGCPYCGGRGMKVVPQKELVVNGRKIANEVSTPCICVLNRHVSQKHNRLVGIGDVTPDDAIDVAKKLSFTNAVFHGSEQVFLYVLKCFIVMHFPFNRVFSVLTGSDIAEKYAMAQPNGVIPTVDLLTLHDLTAILCVARVNNKAIGPGTQEVISNRLRANKPTWIFSPDASALLSSKELAGDEIRGSGTDLIAGWPVFQLADLFPNISGVGRISRSFVRRSQSIAADL